MNDDFNTAQVIAGLFNLTKTINTFNNGSFNTGVIREETFDKLKSTFLVFVSDILGLTEELDQKGKQAIEEKLQGYSRAKEAKDYDKVDLIRGEFKELGLMIRDMKHKIDWAYEE